jgi:integrase/recombinase XerD
MNDPSRVRVNGPLEPYATSFGEVLARQGYAPSSAASQLKLVAHLSRWMAGEGVLISELTPDRAEQFVATRRAAGYRHFLSPRGLRPLLRYLGERGVVGEPAPRAAESSVERLLVVYRAYLFDERSLAEGTIRYYERVARLFLNSISKGDGLDVAAITTGDVSRFVLAECRRRSVGTAKTVVMALRSLLRYLYVEGLSATALVGAVPAVAPWRSASLPRALDRADLARLLASCDRRSITGRRDFAVLVVLARLGLRAGEVAALCLDDIDWGAGEVLVRGKGDRHERLPLPEDVGDALAKYLRRGHAGVECRSLFLRVHAPTGGLSGAGVSNIVRAACRRAGVPEVGAHRLRHFVGTETLRAGASLSEIGQLLRQRSSFTTGLYAKADRSALLEVSGPWMGGAR